MSASYFHAPRGTGCSTFAGFALAKDLSFVVCSSKIPLICSSKMPLILRILASCSRRRCASTPSWAPKCLLLPRTCPSTVTSGWPGDCDRARPLRTSASQKSDSNSSANRTPILLRFRVAVPGGCGGRFRPCVCARVVTDIAEESESDSEWRCRRVVAAGDFDPGVRASRSPLNCGARARMKKEDREGGGSRGEEEGRGCCAARWAGTDPAGKSCARPSTASGLEVASIQKINGKSTGNIFAPVRSHGTAHPRIHEIRNYVRNTKVRNHEFQRLYLCQPIRFERNKKKRSVDPIFTHQFGPGGHRLLSTGAKLGDRDDLHCCVSFPKSENVKKFKIYLK
jgi:hypothetical protein